MDMNWLDWAIVIIVLISAVIGFKRGMVRELVSLGSWVAAILLARTLGPQVSEMLEPYVSHDATRTGLGLVLTALVVIITGSVIGRIAGKAVLAAGLGAVDRLLGLVFGGLRGIAILVLLTAVVTLTPFAESGAWQDSRFSDPLEDLRDQAMGLINEQIS